MNQRWRGAVARRKLRRHQVADIALRIGVEHVLRRYRKFFESGGELFPIARPIGLQHGGKFIAGLMAHPTYGDSLSFGALQEGRVGDNRSVRAVSNDDVVIEPPAHADLLFARNDVGGRQIGHIEKIAAGGAQIGATPRDILIPSHGDKGQPRHHHPRHMIRRRFDARENPQIGEYEAEMWVVRDQRMAVLRARR